TTAGEVTMQLAQRGLAGDREGMMAHAARYLDLLSTVVIAWQWLLQAAAARERREDPFTRGKLAAAQYWIRSELPRVEQLAALCRSGEDSYASARAEWF